MKKSLLFISTLLAAGTISAWADPTTYAGVTWTDSSEELGDGTTINVRTFTGTADNTDYIQINGTGTSGGLSGTTGTGAITIDKLVFSSVTIAELGTDQTVHKGPWFGNSAISQAIDLQGTGLEIKGGSSTTGYVCFNGVVTGATTSAFTWLDDAAGNVQNFVFTGNLSGFYGNFVRTTASYNAATGGTGATNAPVGALQFGADTAGTAATNTNISGTGSITTSSVLRYNYSGANTSDGTTQATDALVIGNSAITARYLLLKGGANYEFTNAVSGWMDAGDATYTAANNTLHIAAGTTTFKGDITNFGNVIVEGTLALADTANLDLSGVAVTISGIIQNSGTGTVTFSDTTSLDLVTTLTSATTDITVVSGNMTDWNNLSTANITLNGAAIDSNFYTISKSGTDGVVTISVVASTLVWTGSTATTHDGADSTYDWNTTTQNWADSTGTASAFTTNSNVIFNNSATNKKITLTEDVTVGNAIVSSGEFTVVGNGKTLAGGTLTIDAGKFQIGGSQDDSVTVNFSNIIIKEGATLTYNNGYTSLKKITLEGGNFSIFDLYGDETTNTLGNAGLSIETLEVNQASSMSGTWSHSKASLPVEIQNLTGSGDLAVSQSNEGYNLIVSNMHDYTGTLEIRALISAELTIAKGDSKTILWGQNAKNITKKGEGTMVVSSSSAWNWAGTLTIDGGTVDMNAKAGTYNLVLNGGNFVNNGSNTAEDGAQLTQGITLTADSGIGGTGNFGVIGSKYAAVTIKMNGNTLTKTGSNTVFLYRTNFTGGGTIVVDAGILKFAVNDSASHTIDLGTTNIVVNSGGQLTLSNAGVVSGSGTITFNGNANFSFNKAMDSSGWTGKVVIADRGTDGTSGTLGAIHGLVASGKTLEIKGAYGYVANDSVDFSSNVILSNSDTRSYGMKITNGWEGYALTFSGSVSGSGDFVSISGPSNYDFKFTGSLKGYSGSFISTKTSNGDLYFGGSSDAGMAGITDGSVSGTGTINWLYGAGQSVVYYNYTNDVYASNSLAGTTYVKKLGDAELDLRGAADVTDAAKFTGTVEATAGTLKISNKDAIGADGNVLIDSGASLKIAVKNVSAKQVTISTGAQLILGEGLLKDLTFVNDEASLDIICSAAIYVNGTQLSESNLTSLLTDDYVDLSEISSVYTIGDWAYANNTLSLTLSIPEPSMFGLLAGTLALGLVGTHRRRRGNVK